jgi:hypothetical protein
MKRRNLSMRLEWIKFQGVEVGFRMLADSDGDRRLLWALRGQAVRVSETFGMEMPASLVVCPSLPWENQTVIGTGEEKS